MCFSCVYCMISICMSILGYYDFLVFSYRFFSLSSLSLDPGQIHVELSWFLLSYALMVFVRIVMYVFDGEDGKLKACTVGISWIKQGMKRMEEETENMEKLMI